MKEEMQLQLNKYFKKKYSDYADYEVVLKPVTLVNLQTNENVKSIINSAFYIFNSGKGTALQMFRLVDALAVYLNDRLVREELQAIIKRDKKVPSISVIEIVLQKYLTMGYRLDKKINFGSKRFALSELSAILQEKQTQIFLIFIKILKDNDIQVPFSMPNFSNIENDFGEL